MSDPFIIRNEPADTADAKMLIRELDAVLGALYAPEDRHGLSLAALLDPSVSFFLARADGEAVGCGAIKRMLDGYAEVKRMYVRPDWRGKGVAKAVLQALEREARRFDISILRLETGIHQSDAVRLYEKAGFKSRGPFGDYRDTGISLFYEKLLSE